MSTMHAMVARQEYPDSSKGVLVFLVVLGHCLQLLLYRGSEGHWHDPLFQAIYMVHMPMFIAISGYFQAISLRRDQSFGSRLARIGWLLVPAFVLTFIDALWIHPSATHQGLVGIARHLVGTAFFSYWFLWVLVLCLFASLALKTWRLDRGPTLVATAMGLLLLPDLWLLHFLKFLFPFFALGYWISQRGYVRRESVTWGRAAIGLGISAGILLTWDSECFVYQSRMRMDAGWAVLLRIYAGALIGGMTGFAWLWLLARNLQGSTLSRIMARVGKASLGIYLFQGFLIDLIVASGLSGLVANHWAALAVAVGITTIAWFVVELISLHSVFSLPLLGRPAVKVAS